MVESSIDTSSVAPSPVRAAPASAADTAIAAFRPAIASLTGKPTRSGALSSSPVTLMMPESP